MTRAAALAVALLAVAPTPAAHAQEALPDVVLLLTVEIRDTAGWFLLHDRLLATPGHAPKPLEVSTAAGPRGRRTIVVNDPKFDVTLVRPGGFHRVVVQGKLTGTDARATLSVFQQAVLDRAAAPGETDLLLFYGLTTVGAHLLELRVLPRP